MVTYPLAEGETEPRTEEFVNVVSARIAASKVTGATYDRKSAAQV